MSFDSPSRRRWWLLMKALESEPLNHGTLLLARAAEGFLLGEAAAEVEDEAPPTVVSTAARAAESNGMPAAAERDVVEGNTTVAVTTVGEVVLYLRRQQDSVVPQTNGLFLVNSHFLENPDQLLGRANRARKRLGLPDFLFLPNFLLVLKMALSA